MATGLKERINSGLMNNGRFPRGMYPGMDPYMGSQALAQQVAGMSNKQLVWAGSVLGAAKAGGKGLGAARAFRDMLIGGNPSPQRQGHGSMEQAMAHIPEMRAQQRADQEKAEFGQKAAQLAKMEKESAQTGEGITNTGKQLAEMSDPAKVAAEQTHEPILTKIPEHIRQEPGVTNELLADVESAFENVENPNSGQTFRMPTYDENQMGERDREM